jgi:hypothetical protein
MPLASMEHIENAGVQAEEPCASRPKLGDGWEMNAG